MTETMNLTTAMNDFLLTDVWRDFVATSSFHGEDAHLSCYLLSRLRRSSRSSPRRRLHLLLDKRPLISIADRARGSNAVLDFADYYDYAVVTATTLTPTTFFLLFLNRQELPCSPFEDVQPDNERTRMTIL